MSGSSSSSRNRLLWQVALLASSFCLVFSSFSAAQNAQTTNEDASLGALTLFVLYFTFTFANLVSAPVVRALGTRLSMFSGALCYCIFVAANSHIYSWLAIATAFLNGVGAAVIWTAQGAFVAQCSRTHDLQTGAPPSTSLGSFNGVFFSIFQVNQFLGNLVVALLFQNNFNRSHVFTIAAILATVGTFSILATGRTPLRGRPSFGAADEMGLIRSASLSTSLELLLESKMLLLSPFIVLNGASAAFIFGDLGALADSDQVRFYVMSVFGAADALSSVVFGRLSDRVGRLPVSLTGLFVHLTTMVVILASEFEVFTGAHKGSNVPVSVQFLLAIASGVVDGVYNTQGYAIVGALFEDAEAAFASFKFFQSLMIAVAFLYRPKTTLSARVYIQIVLWAMSVVGLFRLRRHGHIDAKAHLPHDIEVEEDSPQSGGRLVDMSVSHDDASDKYK